MFTRKVLNSILSLLVVASLVFGGGLQASAQSPKPQTPAPASGGAAAPAKSPTSGMTDELGSGTNNMGQMRTMSNGMRTAAATRLDLPKKGTTLNYAGVKDTSKLSSTLATQPNAPLASMAPPLSMPDYFAVPNYANSPLPALDGNGQVIAGSGIRKFVDTLPGICQLGGANINALGQCIPLAVADSLTFPGSDFYEIAVVEYREQMHRDLPGPCSDATGSLVCTPNGLGTKLRGYVQLYPLGTIASNAPAGAVEMTTVNGLTSDVLDSTTGLPRWGYFKPHYLGPLIIATGCDKVAAGCVPVPVRVKFDNLLPSGPAGELFIPTDTTYMGAGMGPNQSLAKVNVTAGGSGYTVAPTVVFTNTGTGGTGAAATANILGGQVISITITNGGSGYVTAPAVTFSGGNGVGAAATSVLTTGSATDAYSQNRATLHLHGGNTPWISDGTPHQWTTPAGEGTLTAYTRGDSVAFVPDMWFDASGNLISACAGQITCDTTAHPGATNDPGLGSLTFYWTNQQSGRLMFYHDHAYGITRLNVYAGEAAGYLLVDQGVDTALQAAGFPGALVGKLGDPTYDVTHLIPLVIQDKTYVPDSGVDGGQLAATDPTWDVAKYGGFGNLWYPHVYTPNQNPYDLAGANAFGRWDWGPWFWPAQDPTTFVPEGQPKACTSAAYPGQTLTCPGTPNPSGTPEAFMDTPVINGTAFPSLTVDPTAYRFQILSAGNDRALNLGWYVADPLAVAVTAGGSGYTVQPTIDFSAGGGTGAAATAILATGNVTVITVTLNGAGYTVVPNVVINGNGTGATASAVLDPINGNISEVRITNQGTGYTAATVAIDPPAGCLTGCVTAKADATVEVAGSILGLVVTNPGTGYSSSPFPVTITGDGSGAAAVASANSDVKMVAAVPHYSTDTVKPCNLANPTGGAMLVGALLDTAGNPINGTGLPAGCWPSSWPVDGRDGGVPDPATAGPPFIQIGTEAGRLPSAVVIPSTPVGFEYVRRSITVLNIFQHGLLIGPAERADVAVDFTLFAGKTLILYNDAPAPVPAFDSRIDYYTGDPDQSSAGGAPTTLPGYGPNTRTLMQVKVRSTPATPPVVSFSLPALAAAQPAVFAAFEDKIIIPESVFPAANGGGAPTYVRISDTSLTAWDGGPVGSLTLTSGGAGYTSIPNVVIAAPPAGGTTALATANLAPAGLASVTLTNATSGGFGYTTAPTVSFTGGGGTGAAATATLGNAGVRRITVGNGGSGYTSAPTVNIAPPPAGGIQATATATVQANGTRRVTAINVTNPGRGYVTAPAITFSGGGGSGATATSALGFRVTGFTLTQAGSGYTTAPGITVAAPAASNCVPSALCTAATATATLLPRVVASLTLTNPGNGYRSAPAVNIDPPTGPGSTATAVANPPAIPLEPKAIQELFTLDYGRMNATLGVELKFTNFNTQTTIPYGYVDPPTEIFKDGETQIWKITHNGVDTHFIHFHLFNVQVLNRVGWDGAIKPPDANEVGWKDTVRMNPLEDIIVALRTLKQDLPWKLPNSVRPMDVTAPIGSTSTYTFSGIDPANQPAPVTNDLVNFGYEYVWHCHILGHEENDMMRAMILGVAPDAPTNLQAFNWTTASPFPKSTAIKLTWNDNSVNETGFTVLRSIDLTPGSWESLPVPAHAGTGPVTFYVTTWPLANRNYYYQVIANNVVGYTKVFAAPIVGYPSVSYDSAPTAIVGPIAPATGGSAIGPFAPSQESSLLFASSFESGLAVLGASGSTWWTASGNVLVQKQAALAPNVGTNGLAAVLSSIPAFVSYDIGTEQTRYVANFYFNPNNSNAGATPVDIFVGKDGDSNNVFGIQYQTIVKESEPIHQIRSWVMHGGTQSFTPWVDFAEGRHYLDVSWSSGMLSRLDLYVDDVLTGVSVGDNFNQTLRSVVLGPSSGLSDTSTGTLYFDEISSSAIDVPQFGAFVPVIFH